MQASQPANRRSEFVSGEFVTRTFRISGEVMARDKPLLDRLNDHDTSFITLERMYISPLLDPTMLTGHFTIGEVRKDRLSIVVLSQSRERLSARQGPYGGRDYVDNQVLLVVAGFEVRGALRLDRSVNVPAFVRTTPEQFIPLLNAQAVFTAQRDVVFEGDAILVNRAQMEVFALQAAIAD